MNVKVDHAKMEGNVSMLLTDSFARVKPVTQGLIVNLVRPVVI